MSLLKEDYANYLSDCSIDRAIHYFLLESDICYKSYEFIRTLLDDAISNQYNNAQVLNLVKELSLRIIGRDIFERKIEIIDGHDSSSYFWIMPVKIIDYTDTNDLDNVAEMRGVEISIEENNVEQYLLPFLYKHFDDELEANRHRKSVSSFQWYLTYNFFSFDSITAIINDIKDTIAVLSAGRDNEFTEKLKIKRGLSAHKLIYAKNFSKEEIDSYNANRPKVNDTETDLIIDFYRRFIYRMEYMLKVGEEKGYNLISFMGP
ncbi:MAG: hypothetical protein IKV21_04120, partial [Clostridia bacterium]|nr:hypothetical protein [Clostridia bacterium]